MNIVNLNEFRGQTSALASIVRVGDFNKQFAGYHTLNLLPGRRAVIDAYNVKRQKDLIRELRANGYELILDTKGAELACPFKWSGQARKAEWLEKDIQRALSADSFNESMATKIAHLAVAGGFHVVLAPGRYVSESSSTLTLEQDFEFLFLLRSALDSHGGSHIKIASSFIGRLTLLGQDTVTDRLVSLVQNSPADAMWFRLSGLRRDPGPSRIRTTARRLHLLGEAGLPIILDYAAGLEPLALLSLGAASGLSFGALANDQFKDDTWVKQSKLSNSLQDKGRRQFARAPGLGRNLSQAELQLLSEVPKGKRLLFDPVNTGLSSFENFKKKSKEIALNSTVNGIERLSETPDLRRTHLFKTEFLEPSAHKATQLAGLKLDTKRAEELNIKAPEGLGTRLQKYATSLTKTVQALEVITDEFGARMPKPIILPHNGETIVTKKSDET